MVFFSQSEKLCLPEKARGDFPVTGSGRDLNRLAIDLLDLAGNPHSTPAVEIYHVSDSEDCSFESSAHCLRLLVHVSDSSEVLTVHLSKDFAKGFEISLSQHNSVPLSIYGTIIHGLEANVNSQMKFFFLYKSIA
jgi:hypothetical protein